MTRLGADPPRWLTGSHAALIDGPLYVADAAAAAGAPADAGALDPTGGVPPWYRKPLYTALCAGVYRVAGASPETLALPSALAGAALAPAVYLLLAPAAGGWTALLAALFVAVDAIGVAWSRTAVPYPAVALAEVGALGIAAAGLALRGHAVLRAGLLALALAALTLAAWGLKPIALAALVPLAAVIDLGGLAPAGSRRRARALAWLAGAALVLGALFLVRADLADALARVRAYARDPTFAEAVRRPFHLPAATGASALAPAVVALVLVAPVLLRPGPGVSAALRAAARAALLTVAAGAAVLGALQQPDVPYLLAFWPAALVLAALTLRALAVGGAPPLRRPALAAGWIAGALVFAALDALATAAPRLAELDDGAAVLAEVLGGLGDVYYFAAARFLRTLLLAGLVGALAAALAWRQSGRRAAVPSRPRPGLAAGIAVVHVAWEIALSGSVLVWPAETLRTARADLRAILPAGAVLGEHFAHALADGREVRARYFVVSPDGDALTAARRGGTTHVAVAADRWAVLVRPRLGERGEAPASVASLYVGAAQVRVARLPGVESRSPFERARALMDAGDWTGARAALREAATRAPAAPLPWVHLAVASALAGDLDAATRALGRARTLAPEAFLVHVADVLLHLRRGEPALGLRAAEAAYRRVPDRRLERFVGDLRAALSARDARALARLRGGSAQLLATDLLR